MTHSLTKRTETGAGKTCLFIMLNPSTADANSDDPTIKRCMNFARRWGMAELRVVNLFALRATDPRYLFQHVTQPVGLVAANGPVGPENDRVITAEIQTADLIVEAWGNHGAFGGRADQVRALLSHYAGKVWHLGVNVTGEPRHPLYVRSDAGLTPAIH